MVNMAAHSHCAQVYAVHECIVHAHVYMLCVHVCVRKRVCE